MPKLKYFYGEDPEAKKEGQRPMAFFWPDSPTKRREMMSVKRNAPDIFQSTYQCKPGQRVGSIFVEDDFAYFEPPRNLAMGANDRETRTIIEKGHMVLCGWDTAFEATSAANHTVCVTALLMPCNKYHRGELAEIYGECDAHFDVLILDVMREKLQWGDLVAKFRFMHRKWLPTIHVIEQRANGINLYHSMHGIGINVEGVDAKESKRARAVEGTKAGSVQGWFRQHRVQFPRYASWLKVFETELKDFTGDKGGTDDQVDALVHTVNYAIKLSQNMFLLPSDWAKEEDVDALMGINEEIEMEQLVPEHQAQARNMLNFILMAPGLSEDPSEGFCMSCTNKNRKYYCKIQKRTVASFDSCDRYDSGNNYNFEHV